MAVLTAAQVRESRTARLRRRIQDNLLAYAFMAAGLVCFAFFSWYPLVKGVILSFQQDNFVTPPYWVGLENYRRSSPTRSSSPPGRTRCCSPGWR